MSKPITHSFQIQLLLFTGLLGFLIGVYLLFNPKNEYHDFVFHPKEVVDTLLAMKQLELFPTPPDPDSILMARATLRKIQRFDELDTAFPHDFARLTRPRPNDTVRRRMASYILYALLARERRRIQDLADTSLNSRYFVGSLFALDKGKLAGIYTQTDTSNAARTFFFRYDHDTTYPELSIHAEGPYTIARHPYPATGLSFFARYPGFGTFALLMIFQFVAFFIVIPLSIMTVIQLRDEQSATPRDVWKVYVISLGVVFAYAGIIYAFIVTPSYIGDSYFMEGFKPIVWIYYIMAYVSGICCYAGYLFTGRLIAGKMQDFQGVAHTQRNNLVQKEALTNAASPFAEAFRSNAPPEAATALSKSIATNTDAIADTGKTIADLADEYKKLRSHFTIFFYTSAFLLSMIVLETGSLFSAIGSLDLVRFLNAPPAHGVIRNDFVYLLGGLYSILLLIFYVPVKISMINLENQLPDTTVTNNGGSSWLPVFSSGLRTTASVLAASSPFLISIIQYILSNFSGGK